jgi:primosomal replication protein N''
VTAFVKVCPSCKSERPAHEIMCEGLKDNERCAYPLFDVPLARRGARRPEGAHVPSPGSGGSLSAPTAAPPFLKCGNGHDLRQGDLLCPVCGLPVIDPSTTPQSPDATTVTSEAPSTIDKWNVESELPADSGLRRFVVRADTSAPALLTLYESGAEPDVKIFETLQRQPQDHVEHIHAIGRWKEQAYCISERIEGGTLANYLKDRPATLDMVTSVLREVGGALASFSTIGLRHRSLRPDNILVRSNSPLDLVVTSFGSARLSDFDLDIAAPLQVSRYSAPEVIVGAVSAASDWWSLGTIILEYLAGPQFTSEVSDQAFMLGVVTRGIALPKGLDPRLELLLRGLLARDPNERWQWKQVTGWLDGESVDAPAIATDSTRQTTRSLRINGRDYFRSDEFALAAADAANWEEGRRLILRGEVTSWAEQAKLAADVLAALRRLAGSPGIADDHRHALSLMELNRDLPLTLRGQIVTPNWLLVNAPEAYELICGPAISILRQHDSARWLVQVADRVQRIQERATTLEISLDDAQFRVLCLATSRPRLDALWVARRTETPDSDHPGLASLLDRVVLSDEDLILLLSASPHQFEPADAILDRAVELAERCGIKTFDRAEAAPWLAQGRRELYTELESRLVGFARCGIEIIDEWADVLRVQRRLSLQRSLVMLALPAGEWREPPRQKYVENLLDFFEKRAASVAQRGPLVRLILGKTTARVDMKELDSSRSKAEILVDRILGRTGELVRLDPEVLLSQATVTDRLRRLQNHAAMYRRDTGVDGMYMGFPFLVVRMPGNVRPRIMPIFLWPVRIALELGSRSNGSISFDIERSEVRLNPAIPPLLGQDDTKLWREHLDEILQRSALNVGQIMDVLSSHVPARERSLVRLPNKDYIPAQGQRELVCSAVLFHAEFMGQSIAEDLRALRRKPLDGTALDRAIHAKPSQTPEVVRHVAVSDEISRYPVTDSDPSQEEAVVLARSTPGLLIEGPPGTGKSQTIVNIVSDCIGRGESVLIVCQKQAAIQVVAKRLEAEGIQDRMFVVSDANSDRRHVITKLREQIDRARNAAVDATEALRASRQTVAKQIERLESDVDGNHSAFHRLDPTIGLSYRMVLSELIAIEEAGGAVDAPGIREHLERLAPAGLAALQDAVDPVAAMWLQSRFESSALSVTKQFTADVRIANELRRHFVNHVTLEATRSKVMAETPGAFEIAELPPHEKWLDSHDQALAAVTEETRLRLATWYDQFLPRGEADSEGLAAINALQKVRTETRALREPTTEASLADQLAHLPSEDCKSLQTDTERVIHARSMLSRISPARMLSWIRIRAFLKKRNLNRSREGIESLHLALTLERALRPLRTETHKWLGRFAGNGLSGRLVSVRDVSSAAEQLLTMLQPLVPLATAVSTCPLRNECELAIRSGAPNGYGLFAQRYHGALKRLQVKIVSRASVQQLARWLDDDWIAGQQHLIQSNKVRGQQLRAIVESLPRLVAYQDFRRRAPTLPAEALALLRSLREYEDLLANVDSSYLINTLRQTLAREAYLAWKDRLETTEPSLLLDRDMLSSRVQRLETFDREFRRLNRELLALDTGLSERPPREPWESITRLTGTRARRLRELFEQGLEPGLLKLRPVWLMNPDVASRVLPLRAGLFDVVVFDEASQIPVEHSLPALFRASRVVISGDEKQMPPSTFFASRLESDEDELFDPDELDAAATESERTAIEENLTRREIKDCEDLLTLARSFLPTAMLKIHYRSNFRELITFSNSAFYGGSLFVPVQNPTAQVKRSPPISIRRVNGLYKGQTNVDEAKEVINVLGEIWGTSPEMRPSLGVVTFNRKQADLIEDMIEERAEEDSSFREALGTESERRQRGEDMGFFVKNVENVQGDERDVIVFSTTFGRDESGAFNRRFGVLGQLGGERRLNVAVTRARDRVILVSSLPVGEISDMMATGHAPSVARDYLQGYMEYATRISAGDLASAHSVASRFQRGVAPTSNVSGRTHDAFVRSVGKFLGSLDVRIDAHSAVDGVFGLDFALEHPQTGLYVLGVECDAPRHGLLTHARAREIWRRGVLKRSLPVVHRVSSYAWYHEPQSERERLRKAVAGPLAKKS